MRGGQCRIGEAADGATVKSTLDELDLYLRPLLHERIERKCVGRVAKRPRLIQGGDHGDLTRADPFK